MDETITLFMTTLFLATSGVCLYIYSTSEEGQGGGQDETITEEDYQEEDTPLQRTKNKTRRNRKQREIER
jgi:hypothetical protein